MKQIQNLKLCNLKRGQNESGSEGVGQAVRALVSRGRYPATVNARVLLPAAFGPWAVRTSLSARESPSSLGGPLATRRLARTSGRRHRDSAQNPRPHSIHHSLLPRSWLTGARHDAQWLHDLRSRTYTPFCSECTEWESVQCEDTQKVWISYS